MPAILSAIRVAYPGITPTFGTILRHREGALTQRQVATI
jgi:hypothetical protein